MIAVRQPTNKSPKNKALSKQNIAKAIAINKITAIINFFMEIILLNT